MRRHYSIPIWFNICCIICCVCVSSCSLTKDHNGEDTSSQPVSSVYQTWSHYLGDPGRSHYSTLNQIDTSNVTKLEVIWTYESGGLVEGRRSEIQTNSLVVDTVLYGVNPGLILFAINANTGEELWKFAPNSKDGSGLGVNRGLSYWEDGEEEAILFFSAGSFLYAINPSSGKLRTSFGDSGKVDLREGLGREPATLSVVANTPGAIFQDLLIMGTRVAESPGASPGHIRAYNVVSGKIEWTFRTIPQPGESGYDTWPKEAYKTIGGANNWSGMALDIERGMVFLPTGSAAFDFYGGNRHGQNLFANCILALNAKTGKRIWHYQFVHHDLWDRDLPAPPNLIMVEQNGQKIAAVAQTTKSGHIFLFNRETGEPLFPINEIEFPESDLDGEKTWPTQPLPEKPVPFARQELTEEMLYAPQTNAYVADFVDTLINVDRVSVLERFRQVKSAGQYIPPDTSGVIVFPGFDGGAEWGGAAVNPSTGVMFVNSNEMAWIYRMKSLSGNNNISQGQALYEIQCARCHGGDRQGLGPIPELLHVGERLSTDSISNIVKNGRGAMPPNPQLSKDEIKELVQFLTGTESGGDHRAIVSTDVPYSVAGFGRFLDERGYPVVKPPWGTLNAVDLNNGEYLWQVPLGNIEELNDPEYPVTGTENYGGPVVTAGGLIFIAATKDEKIRAFSEKTGKQLWEANLPAGGYATPATFQVDGRQIVVIACGGGKMGTKSGDKYVAFALPL